MGGVIVEETGRKIRRDQVGCKKKELPGVRKLTVHAIQFALNVCQQYPHHASAPFLKRYSILP
jgi:hypothetical protein